MIDRLRDEADSSDPRLAHAAKLVRSARLPEECPVSKTRVAAAVRERLAAPVPRFRLRPAFALVILLAASAAAASVTWAVVNLVSSEAPSPATPEEPGEAQAALQGRLAPARPLPAPEQEALSPSPSVGPLLPPSVAPVPVEPRPLPQKRATPRSTPVLATRPLPESGAIAEPPSQPAERGQPELPPRIVARASDEPAVAEPSPAPALAPVPRIAEKASPPQAPTQPTEAVPSLVPDEEVTLAQAAFDALRRQGKPRLASRLLARYLRRFPEGKLVEEVLGMAIEAAAALSDPSAGALAKRYLRQFPDGEFRQAAERAVRRFPP